jgi:iron complex outermembrane recepter protein
MMKMHFLGGAGRNAIVLALAGIASPALADPQTAPGQIVVSGAQQVQPDTAPAIVPLTAQFSESTMSAETVKNLSTNASLQTMLENQPSIFTYQNGPNGVGANIFFRGFDSGQFAETFDGLPMNDVFNGGVTGQASTWNSVLFIPQDVDSVVLHNGISNPAQNSYNSLGGTIDFLPKQPTDKFGMTASANYGSFNSWGLNGSVNTGNIGGIKQLIQVDYRQSDGWMTGSADKNLNIYYSGRHDGADGSMLSLIGVFNHNTGFEPYSMPVPVLSQNGGYALYSPSTDYEYARDNEWAGILEYKAIVSSNVTFDSKFFGSGQDFLRTSYGSPTYNGAYPLPDATETYNYWIYFPDGPTYNPKTVFGSNAVGNAYHFYGYTTTTFGYSPKFTIALPHQQLIIGGNLTYGELHSREYWYGSAPVPENLGYNDAWDEHDTRLLASVYAQDEIKLLDDMLTLTPGVKYIYARTRDTDAVGIYYPYGGSVGDNEDFVAPTFGANWKLNDHLAFNFAFGQNIKLPDISAYYAAVPGTTGAQTSPVPVNLKPEHVNDYELGVKYQDGGLSVGLDVYREDFSNVFVDQFNATYYITTVTNGGSARYQGIEFQAADTFNLGDAGTLNAHVNASYNQAKYTSNFTADSAAGSLSDADYSVYAGERMADVPDVLVMGGLTWNYRGYRFDVAGRYIGQQLLLNKTTGAPSTTGIDGYAVFDVGLSKTLALDGGRNVKLSLFANNLFDKYYYNTSYVQTGVQYANPAAPRSVSGKIEFAF